MYRFNWRTAKPLEPLSAPGCDKPTSRCQITPSIGTLKSGKPVIPSVPFIFWATSYTGKDAGSLCPTIWSRFDCKVSPSSRYSTIALADLVPQIWVYYCEPSLLSRRRPPQSNYLACIGDNYLILGRIKTLNCRWLQHKALIVLKIGFIDSLQ